MLQPYRRRYDVHGLTGHDVIAIHSVCLQVLQQRAVVVFNEYTNFTISYDNELSCSRPVVGCHQVPIDIYDLKMKQCAAVKAVL